MTPAEDKRYHALDAKAEAEHKRWRCIRDETWGVETKGARRREELAYTRARNAEGRLTMFVEEMESKYRKGTA